jgi:hypothetical protein
MATSDTPPRIPMSMQPLVTRRQQLEEIVAHHKARGRDYMSMTKVIEMLIEREHRRLKLSDKE